MKRTAIQFILLFFFATVVYGQTYRDHFFDDRLTINDSTSLVLIIRHPQTEFAKQLNHRIYNDTSYIKHLKESWYIEHDANEEKLGHRCGFDMYFYELSGNEFTFLDKLNSNCGLSEIGCTNLAILYEAGKPLRVDTLLRIPFNTIKEDLFNESLIEAYYEKKQEWKNAKTNKYPQLYYDGTFKTKIQLDSHYTIRENAENFVRRFTDTLEGINWTFYYPSLSKIDAEALINFRLYKEPCNVKVKFFLKSSRYDLFKTYPIEKIPFRMKMNENLLLFYRD